VSKTEDAFRNIGEVSEELGVKKHVLRFWELKFPQLKPMKRGGGRRLYRPADVQLLKGIRDLLQSSGYTIKGVQKILREQGIERVKDISSDGAGIPRRTMVVPKAASAVFTAVEVQALQGLQAELETCRVILARSVAHRSADPRRTNTPSLRQPASSRR
jgi:DNA-binding transcriptional MerR regulator